MVQFIPSVGCLGPCVFIQYSQNHDNKLRIDFTAFPEGFREMEERITAHTANLTQNLFKFFFSIRLFYFPSEFKAPLSKDLFYCLEPWGLLSAFIPYSAKQTPALSFRTLSVPPPARPRGKGAVSVHLHSVY